MTITITFTADHVSHLHDQMRRMLAGAEPKVLRTGMFAADFAELEGVAAAVHAAGGLPDTMVVSTAEAERAMADTGVADKPPSVAENTAAAPAEKTATRRETKKAEKQDAAPPEAPVAEEPAAPATETPAALDYTKDIVPKVLGLANQHGRPAIEAVLAQFGVKNAKDLSAEQYPALLQAIESYNG